MMTADNYRVSVPHALWDEMGQPRKARIEVSRPLAKWHNRRPINRRRYILEEEDPDRTIVRLTVMKESPNPGVRWGWPGFVIMRNQYRKRVWIYLVSYELVRIMRPMLHENFPPRHPNNLFPVELELVDNDLQMIIHRPRELKKEKVQIGEESGES